MIVNMDDVYKEINNTGVLLEVDGDAEDIKN